jgi:D-aminopeptidase
MYTQEEAILNAMCAAETISTVKPAGGLVKAIDHAALQACLKKYGRLEEGAAKL